MAIMLGRGLFADNKADLTLQARAEVARIAALLKKYPSNRIALEGHTDSTGPKSLNEKLAVRRAESVRAALIAAGVSASQIDVAGFASTRPVGDNKTLDGRAMNRRVEIIIVGAHRPVKPN